MNRSQKNRLMGQLQGVAKIATIVALVAMIGALVALQWGLDNPTTTTSPTSNVVETTTSTQATPVTTTQATTTIVAPTTTVVPTMSNVVSTTITTAPTVTVTTKPNTTAKKELPAVYALPDPILPSGAIVISDEWQGGDRVLIVQSGEDQFYLEMGSLDEDGSTRVEIPGVRPFRVVLYPKITGDESSDVVSALVAKAGEIQAAVIAAW